MQFVLPLVALLTVLGAARAWRQSPLYSGKTTLQLLALMLLLVGAVIGLSYAIFSSPINQWPAVQAVVGVLMLVLAVAGGSVAITRITDGHVAQLPASAKLASIHRHNVNLWILRLTASVLVCAAAAFFVPVAWAWLPASLGGFLLLVSTPILTVLYARARRFDFGISALTAAPWIHWKFTPEQMQTCAKDPLAWERAQLVPLTWRQGWRALIIFAAIVAGTIWLFGDGGWVGKVAVWAVLTALFAALMNGVNHLNNRECERRYRRLLAAAPEAYFGAEGLLWGGEYAPWVLSGSYLVEAATSPPAWLVLVFQTLNSGASMRNARRIPTPENCLPDLVLLQRKLRECCPKAAIHVVAPAA